MESKPLTVDLVQFIKVFREAGETQLVDLKQDSANDKVLIKDVQYHPVSLSPIHVSFHKVNLKEKISAPIPVEIIGDEENALVKSGEAMVLQLMNEVIVEALPTNLPQKIVVNVANLAAIDAAVTVAELDIDRANVEVVGAEPEELVVKLANAQMAEEPEEEVVVDEAAAIAAVEATQELTPEEKAAREAAAAEEKKDKEKD